VQLVIADWHMPGMSGEELCKQIRLRHPERHIHVIVLTAETAHEQTLRAFKAGADDYVTKPFEREHLIARVRVGERIVDLEARLVEQCRLEADQNRLRKAVDSMEQVLGVISHELRTPLASVRAMSDVLLTPGGSEMAEAGTFLRSINSEVMRMTDMVNNLLEAARLNSGHARWNWSCFQLRDVCEEAMETVRPLVGAAGLELRCSLASPEMAVFGDSDALRRLLINLVNNSVHHTPTGRVEIIARPETDGQGAWAVISVIDTGTGIPAELMPKLGQAFALNSGMIGAGYIRGSGLGLAICKGIVGTVEISSSSHQTEASGEFTDFSRPQSKAHFGTETWDLST